jgi:hypothetical protein
LSAFIMSNEAKTVQLFKIQILEVFQFSANSG